MLIDWFTVGAQIVNFLVLVWLLKRYLYRPILDAIDLREKRDSAAVLAAGTQAAMARQLLEELTKKSSLMDGAREKLLANAGEQAAADRASLLRVAEQDMKNRNAQHAAAMSADSAQLQGLLARLVTTEVYEVARRALTDLASASLEARMVDTLIRLLGDLDANARAAFSSALTRSAHAARVSTRFVLAAAERTRLQLGLNAALASTLELEFVEASEMVAGIEISVDGHRLAWSIDGYLGSLEERARLLLDPGALPATAATPPAVLVLP